jgi:5-methylcytosine-specific restriction protein A
MPKSTHACPAPACPELTDGGRCPAHQQQIDQHRGGPRDRGYTTHHERTFRRQVLQRDPWCTCQAGNHGHPGGCPAPSHHADHHPRTRRELVRLGLNPHDPQYGRGLCHNCHSKNTAEQTPGGWHSH